MPNSDRTNNPANIFAGLHESGRIERLVFKGEDYNEGGVPIGPLYAEIAGVGAVRAVRYVTITEAIALARVCGTQLIEN
ncbi:MAG: hypothetical protein ACRD3Q_21925 [Terriglobales bacterium]